MYFDSSGNLSDFGNFCTENQCMKVIAIIAIPPCETK